MSISDPPRPTTTPPAQTRFTASLDKLSSTSNTRNSRSNLNLPSGLDSIVSDLPLKSLSSLFTDVVSRTLPSALSLFLIVYLSSPHTRTDGLRGYVPVCVVLGRVGGEVGRRRLGLGLGSEGLSGGHEYYHTPDEETNTNGDRLNSSSGGGDDEEKQSGNLGITSTSASTSTSTSTSASSPATSSSPTKPPSSPSSSSTPTRFRGRKAEILSGALEAAFAIGLSMAVSGNGSGNGNTGLGLGLLVSSSLVSGHFW
jgi:hypothetical protein